MSAAQEAVAEVSEKAAPLGAETVSAAAAPVAAAPAPPAYADAAAPVGATTGAAPVGAELVGPDGKPVTQEEHGAIMTEVTENLTHMNPLPEDMDKECEKAGETIDNLIDPKKGFLIPKSILDKAKGLCVMHVVKAAWGWSGRAGSGVVVAKLPDGTWSAPCAVAMGGAGWGAQVGVSVTDFVFVITTDSGLKAFSRGFNVEFGVNVEVTIGPIGRSGELDIALSDFAPIYTYSKSKGLFAGISLEGTILLQRSGCNKAKYGEGVTGEDILTGKVPRPPNSDHLYNSLANVDALAAKNAKEAAAKLQPTADAPDL